MILCCGEALIDMLPRQSSDGEDAFVPFPGGAVFNTALALGRLGAPSGLFSGISNDFFGGMLTDALAASNVSFDLTKRSDRPTTLAFVRFVDDQAHYAFYDENTAGRMLAPSDLPNLADEISAIFFGGISLAGEPCGGVYQALMAREAARRVTMLDPNIRPDFIADEIAYRARITQMLALADIVKVSDEDLRWIFGAGKMDQQVREILAMGPKVVFLTEGAQGASAFTQNETVFKEAAKVNMTDTVGAGDTFNAGVLAALHNRGELDKSSLASLNADALNNALSLGVRAAGVTVSRAGANPPWFNEL